MAAACGRTVSGFISLPPLSSANASPIISDRDVALLRVLLAGMLPPDSLQAPPSRWQDQPLLHAEELRFRLPRLQPHAANLRSRAASCTNSCCGVRDGLSELRQYRCVCPGRDRRPLAEYPPTSAARGARSRATLGCIFAKSIAAEQTASSAMPRTTFRFRTLRSMRTIWLGSSPRTGFPASILTSVAASDRYFDAEQPDLGFAGTSARSSADI